MNSPIYLSSSLSLWALFFLSGCQTYMENQAARLGPDVTDIEKIQIFDNLWVLSGLDQKQGDFIPSQFVLGAGSAANTAQPTIGLNPMSKIPPNWLHVWEIGSVSWDGQQSLSWSVTPVTNYSDLLRLRLLYEYAFCSALARTPDGREWIKYGFSYEYNRVAAPYGSGGTVFEAPIEANVDPGTVYSQSATNDAVRAYEAALDRLAEAAARQNPSPGDIVLQNIRQSNGGTGLGTLAQSLMQTGLQPSADLPLPDIPAGRPRESLDVAMSEPPRDGVALSAPLDQDRFAGLVRASPRATLQLPEPGFVSRNKEFEGWVEFKRPGIPTHLTEKLYVRSMNDLNQFVFWVLSATPNTSGSGGGGGAGSAAAGGGGKGGKGGGGGGAGPQVTIPN
ncbi:MAG TPA: hypothetical protein VFE31_11185 [Opitutaceae bacterium]|jgi:hypothetical protein|nr:hypothetical protein [Opitutaceae bacterium]